MDQSTNTPASGLLQQVPTKPCHNCRRRRLRCDRSVPGCHKCTSTGQECLGYGKLFKWADGAASRGKLAGRKTLAVPRPARGGRPPRSAVSTPQTTGYPTPEATDFSSPHGDDAVFSLPASPSTEASDMSIVRTYPSRDSTRSPELSTPWVLVDPVFQDISAPYRHYLSYFTNRVCQDLVSWDTPDSNPFRHLIPLTKVSPLLQHVIVAAAAAHMSNLTRPPLVPKDSDSGTLVYPGGREASRRALLDALVAKQKALALLSTAVQDIDAVGCEVVLAAVLFFINVELIESGKHGWKAHLEGAGRIMTCIEPTEGTNETLRDYIVSDCVIYYILASAFNKDEPAQSSYMQGVQISSMLKRAAANSYLCCPTEVLEILLAAAQVSNMDTSDEASAEEAAQQGLQLLSRAEGLDISEWALAIRNHPSLRHVPIDSRMNAGSAHRIACSLYIIQAVPSVKRFLLPGTEAAFEDQLMHHLSSVPDEDPNFKATTWPAFIAGAEASDPERQAWCKDRLQRLVKVVPWGFIDTAMDALDVIWRLKREGKTQEGWVQALKDPDLNFLIV